MSTVPPPAVLRQGNLPHDEKATLICFSHLRWNFVFQRPQHLLTRAAKRFDVLFYEEPIFDESSRSHLNVTVTDDGITVITPRLPRGLSAAEVVVTQRRLLNMFIASRQHKPSLAWYYTPMALQFTAHLDFDCVVYDCMDELSNFKNAPSNMRDLEAELLSRADIVFTGGRALFEAKKHMHQNIYAFPSSIDRAHFNAARSKSRNVEPDDQQAIPHPRVGFFGVIDERTDIELLAEVAQQRPSYQFVILGPVVKIDPATLPSTSNIHWLGQKDYHHLPLYMAHWDAGFMPFAINDATRFISPTKTPEFLAAGIPLVSTPIEDVVKSWGKPGLVSIASTASQMCAEIDRALTVDRSLWLKRVDLALASMSWDQTFAAMLALIDLQPPFRKLSVGNHITATPILGDAHV